MCQSTMCLAEHSFLHCPFVRVSEIATLEDQCWLATCLPSEVRQVDLESLKPGNGKICRTNLPGCSLFVDA